MTTALYAGTAEPVGDPVKPDLSLRHWVTSARRITNRWFVV